MHSVRPAHTPHYNVAVVAVQMDAHVVCTRHAPRACSPVKCHHALVIAHTTTCKKGECSGPPAAAGRRGGVVVALVSDTPPFCSLSKLSRAHVVLQGAMQARPRSRAREARTRSTCEVTDRTSGEAIASHASPPPRALHGRQTQRGRQAHTVTI